MSDKKSLKQCRKLYQEQGAGAVYDYANTKNMAYSYCTPCEAETPTIEGVCAICESVKSNHHAKSI